MNQADNGEGTSDANKGSCYRAVKLEASATRCTREEGDIPAASEGRSISSA